MKPDERTPVVPVVSGVVKSTCLSPSSYGSTNVMAESSSTFSSESKSHPRLVEAKHLRTAAHGEPGSEYLRYSNSIRTTKYTILTFIPKNLFEQFHRVANIYFLAIVILNWVPELNALQPELAMVPLLFVLLVTAVKDIYEDHRRYVNDKEVNLRSCSVFNSALKEKFHPNMKASYRVVFEALSRVVKADLHHPLRTAIVIIYETYPSSYTKIYEKKRWCDVTVGDLVEVTGDGIFPADLLLVDSCDRTTNLCYVETSNLDGETNLKQRSVPKGLVLPEGVTFDASNFKGKVHCEMPHHQIYKFNGYIDLGSDSPTSVPLSKDNLLLRGCVLRNTRRVVGLVIYTGHETKALLNNSGPPSKRSKLEKTINLEVIMLVLLLAILCSIGAIGNRIWTGGRDYRNTLYLPGNELSIDSDAAVIFLVLVIALQVLVPISLYISVEIVKLWQVIFLNWDKHFYSPRTNKRLICRALNLNEDLGQIQYVFSDKTGTLTENEMIFRRCNINSHEYPHSPDVSPNRAPSPELMSAKARRELGPESEPSVPADFKLVERLKENLAGTIEEEFMLVLSICNTVVTSMRGDTSAKSRNGDQKSAVENADSEKLLYESESPDELALVLAAQAYGFVLQGRTIKTVTVKYPTGELVTFDVLNILQFDATRKRMSVIVRRQGTEEILLLTKGADSAVYSCFGHATGTGRFATCPTDRLSPAGSPNPLVSESSETRADATQRYLDMYARQGLRTLCMASRIIPQDEYYAWLQEHEQAECAVTEREELVRLSACRIEQRLELLGSTGIEDRLQDHVADTIAALRAAGINVWVLTGDKQETAVNVAYSCQLIDEDMEVIIMNATTKPACEEQLVARLEELNLQRLHHIESEGRRESVFDPALNFMFPRGRRKQLVSIPTPSTVMSQRQRALIVNGATLQFLLSNSLRLDFLQLAAQCRSVICCRSTPLQKAAVVGLVRESLDVMSLAIGDGANDVSMIQMANIGIGISGLEGQQAVMASDFAISRFYFLRRLLLVHGHWCYDRIARMILYFYYKNALFVFIVFWYQLFNGWSGSVAIEDLYLLLYNLIFTSVPPVITAIADQNLPDHVLLSKPQLYANSQSDGIYSRRSFFITMADALWQSLALYFTSHLAYSDSNVGVLEFGTTQNTACILTVSAHLFIETQYWTWIHHLSLWGSLAVYLGVGLVYNAIPIFPPYFVMEHTIGTVEFWAVTFLSTFIALFPRLVVKSLWSSFQPGTVQIARMSIREEKA